MVAGPHVGAGLFRQQPKLELMHTQDHQVPAARAATAPDLHQHSIENHWVHAVAAPLFRLQDLEEAGLAKCRDHFIVHPPRLFDRVGLFTQHRDQIVGALNEFLCGGNAFPQMSNWRVLPCASARGLHFFSVRWLHFDGISPSSGW